MRELILERTTNYNASAGNMSSKWGVCLVFGLYNRGVVELQHQVTRVRAIIAGGWIMTGPPGTIRTSERHLMASTGIFSRHKLRHPLSRSRDLDFICQNVLSSRLNVLLKSRGKSLCW